MANSLFLLPTFALLFLTTVLARDPNLVVDFIGPNVSTGFPGRYFTYTGLRGGAPPPAHGIGHKGVKSDEFPALDGMGVSMELVEFAPGAVNGPHTHPRGSELLFVLEGGLTVGTTDSRGKLYKNDLQKYDVFLFPEGLPHYEANLNKGEKAVVVMMFGSADAGFVSLAQSLFGSGISDEVLMKTLKVSAETIQELKDAQK
ncbi:hypothetical protein RJ640_014329 [Escallonia rubra]|uniref:Germin-like protein n=1 Tax=Escallonia rubra TaxID=112253 RepID=A0AA88U865_9ASTE|nr:hypothetical protein RJ640_014329 [Escallonia rubra]